MSVFDDWIQILRREAQMIHFHDQHKATLVCTAYDPTQHAIKGMLVPSMVETDWIPLGVSHAGAGFGILIGPKVGSQDALDGDQFHIQFEGGDFNAPMAVHKHFSVPDNPPEVQSGEMLMQHESGNKLFFDQNKQITIQHYAKQGTMVWDQNGNLAWDTKGGTHTVKTSGGAMTIDTGGATLAIV